MFSADASASLAGPDWLRQRRAAGYEAFASTPLPSESEEVWRYSPIDELRLDEFAPRPPDARADGAPAGGVELLAAVRGALGSMAGSVLVHDGRPVLSTLTTGNGNGAGAFAFGRADDVAGSREMLGSVQRGGDALVRLNDAFAPEPLFIDVPAGVDVRGPVLVVHWCEPGATAIFPRTCVRAADGAGISVVEVFAGADGPDRSLLVPVTELSAGEGASVSYVSLQVLPDTAWSIARLAVRGGRGASLRTFTVGLGGSYDRIRADVSVDGKDAHSEILSAYLGEGSQVHDIRTLQDHVAPRTTSELLCQGAVAGRSRSVYSGLIRVHRGAVRSDARQTNHNLVLDEGAHADSVPNLDILENDVKCSHASTVGPIDEDQRYYIESRGVEPDVAEGLIVRGFFDAIIDRGPIPEATSLLQREVHVRLDAALAGRQVAERV
ncbi:MAG TPA: Fe-S cluster assembly protein SufD [Acidimicrobiales bacterium]|nr:Fe-S cluster assembly protein SufD [Acidimicrobiales bacterium]